MTSQISDRPEAGAVRYLSKLLSLTELPAAVDAELEEAQTRLSDL